MTLPELLHAGWTLEFSASGNSVFPVLCRASRIITHLKPDTHRRCLGAAAGIDPAQALSRALALAETNELETITVHVAQTNARTIHAGSLLALLGLDAPTKPPAEKLSIRRI